MLEQQTDIETFAASALCIAARLNADNAFRRPFQRTAVIGELLV
jgi:hypothetical protein